MLIINVGKELIVKHVRSSKFPDKKIKLPGYNYLILRAFGQYTNDDLFVAKQFFIGGVGSIGAGLRLFATKYVSARLDCSVPRIDDQFKTNHSETYVQGAFNF